MNASKALPWMTLAALWATFASLSHAADDPLQVAAKTDELLRSEIPYANAAKAPPPRIDDERFLRRVSLDTIGRPPTPEEVAAFVDDPLEDKRSKIVEKLLADERFGENWGRYWRDVILYRKSEERSQIFAGALEDYLVESFNTNKPWSQIATDFVTAKGDALENGACGLIMAQQGQPEETVAEISRIFLGIQIQCAQCHDHPTDRWTRQQFHELAAFFPRVGRRIIVNPERREVTVTVFDAPLLARRFQGPMNLRFRGTPEHYMPDLDDPSARGSLVQPVFFLTGDKVRIGAPDAERRSSLAEWMTAESDLQFAKAFVNRMWSELNGEGFYEPVDDMGPDRECVAPQTLDHLAGQFAASGYDVKWLFRTIMATELYHSPSRSRRQPDEAPMQYNVAQRLRADQIYDNLTTVLEMGERGLGFGGGRMMAGAGPGGFRGGPRQQFTRVFGYDPSERRDEIALSIPQALMMMNSPLINQASSVFGRGMGPPGGPGFGRPGAARGRFFPPGMPGAGAAGRTMLGRKLAEIDDDKKLVEDLYLQVFARHPSQSELATCLLHVKRTANRTEAFEDILWSLLNSTEFLHRT